MFPKLFVFSKFYQYSNFKQIGLRRLFKYDCKNKLPNSRLFTKCPSNVILPPRRSNLGSLIPKNQACLNIVCNMSSMNNKGKIFEAKAKKLLQLRKSKFVGKLKLKGLRNSQMNCTPRSNIALITAQNQTCFQNAYNMRSSHNEGNGKSTEGEEKAKKPVKVRKKKFITKFKLEGIKKPHMNCKRCKMVMQRAARNKSKTEKTNDIHLGFNKKDKEGLKVPVLETTNNQGLSQSQLPPKNVHVEFMESQNLKDFSLNKSAPVSFNTNKAKQNIIDIRIEPISIKTDKTSSFVNTTDPNKPLINLENPDLKKSKDIIKASNLIMGMKKTDINTQAPAESDSKISNLEAPKTLVGINKDDINTKVGAETADSASNNLNSKASKAFMGINKEDIKANVKTETVKSIIKNLNSEAPKTLVGINKDDINTKVGAETADSASNNLNSKASKAFMGINKEDIKANVKTETVKSIIKNLNSEAPKTLVGINKDDINTKVGAETADSASNNLNSKASKAFMGINKEDIKANAKTETVKSIIKNLNSEDNYQKSKPLTGDMAEAKTSMSQGIKSSSKRKLKSKKYSAKFKNKLQHVPTLENNSDKYKIKVSKHLMGTKNDESIPEDNYQNSKHLTAKIKSNPKKKSKKYSSKLKNKLKNVSILEPKAESKPLIETSKDDINSKTITKKVESVSENLNSEASKPLMKSKKSDVNDKTEAKKVESVLKITNSAASKPLIETEKDDVNTETEEKQLESLSEISNSEGVYIFSYQEFLFGASRNLIKTKQDDVNTSTDSKKVENVKKISNSEDQGMGGSVSESNRSFLPKRDSLSESISYEIPKNNNIRILYQAHPKRKDQIKKSLEMLEKKSKLKLLLHPQQSKTETDVLKETPTETNNTLAQKGLKNLKLIYPTVPEKLSNDLPTDKKAVPKLELVKNSATDKKIEASIKTEIQTEKSSKTKLDLNSNETKVLDKAPELAKDLPNDKTVKTLPKLQLPKNSSTDKKIKPSLKTDIKTEKSSKMKSDRNNKEMKPLNKAPATELSPDLQNLKKVKTPPKVEIQTEKLSKTKLDPNSNETKLLDKAPGLAKDLPNDKTVKTLPKLQLPKNSSTDKKIEPSLKTDTQTEKSSKMKSDRNNKEMKPLNKAPANHIKKSSKTKLDMNKNDAKPLDKVPELAKDLSSDKENKTLPKLEIAKNATTDKNMEPSLSTEPKKDLPKEKKTETLSQLDNIGSKIKSSVYSPESFFSKYTLPKDVKDEKPNLDMDGQMSKTLPMNSNLKHQGAAILKTNKQTKFKRFGSAASPGDISKGDSAVKKELKGEVTSLTKETVEQSILDKKTDTYLNVATHNKMQVALNTSSEALNIVEPPVKVDKITQDSSKGSNFGSGISHSKSTVNHFFRKYILPVKVKKTKLEVNTQMARPLPKKIQSKKKETVEQSILDKKTDTYLNVATHNKMQVALNTSSEALNKVEPPVKVDKITQDSSKGSNFGSGISHSKSTVDHIFRKYILPVKVKKTKLEVNTQMARPLPKKIQSKKKESGTVKVNKSNKFKRSRGGGSRGGSSPGDGGSGGIDNKKAKGLETAKSTKGRTSKFWRTFSITILPFLLGLTIYVFGNVGAIEMFKRLRNASSSEEPLSRKMTPTYYGYSSNSQQLNLNESESEDDDEDEKEDNGGDQT